MNKKMVCLLLLGGLVLTSCGTGKSTQTAAEQSAASASVWEASSGEESDPTVTSSSLQKEPPEADPDSSELSSSSREEMSESSPLQNVMELQPDTDAVFQNVPFRFSIQEPDENGGGSLVLTSGEQSLSLTDYAEGTTNGYAVPGSGNDFYLLIQALYSNDWRETYLVKYSGEDGFSDCGKTDGGVEQLSDVTVDGIRMTRHMDVFGSYGARQTFQIQKDQLTPADSYCEFINDADPGFWDSVKDMDEESLAFMKSIYAEDGHRILTLKADLPASDGTENITVPSGSVITPKGCDPENKIFYFSWEKGDAEVTYEAGPDGYGYAVDGVSENDLFEVVPYAG